MSTVENTDIINKAWQTAKAFYTNGNHDIGHVKRVVSLSMEIQKREGGNKLALILAAILHDIGRIVEDITGEDHAQISADISKKLLRLWHVNSEIEETVYDAIFNHRYSKKRAPKTIEGKILSDADKLDALGAIGIARVFKHDPRRSIYEDVNHFYEKILKQVTQ